MNQLMNWNPSDDNNDKNKVVGDERQSSRRFICPCNMIATPWKGPTLRAHVGIDCVLRFSSFTHLQLLLSKDGYSKKSTRHNDIHRDCQNTGLMTTVLRYDTSGSAIIIMAALQRDDDLEGNSRLEPGINSLPPQIKTPHSTWVLMGVIYGDNSHYVLRFIDEKNKAWQYDGMVGVDSDSDEVEVPCVKVEGSRFPLFVEA